MNTWLLKTDPDTYRYADLQRDGRTVWDGVKNNQALLYLRQMREGDRLLIYHTGNEKAVVGMADVVRGPYPDPKTKDAKLVVIELQATRPLPKPVPLAAIKADRRFADLLLVKMSRLSVMPIPAPLSSLILKMGEI